MVNENLSDTLDDVFKDIYFIQGKLSDLCCQIRKLRALSVRGCEFEAVEKEIEDAHQRLMYTARTHCASSCLLSHNMSRRKSN
jgi:hypothetical protein